MLERLLTEAPEHAVDMIEPSQPRLPIVYISWAESCSRSDHTARELGGKSFMTYLPALGSHPLTIPFKYAGQFFMTLWLLIRERPAAIFVMSPPVIAVFPAYLYGLISGKPFAMDCHTAAYLHPRWRRLQWLQHWLGRRAATNIVTNEHLAELVQARGGKTTIVRDVPVVYRGTERFALARGFTVAAVCSFNADEPIAEIFEAARLLPEITFYVTGNTKHLEPALARRRPENLKLTGFISDEAYGDLISRAGIVMSLTSRDHTMLRGAWEAIYQGTPVIVSDWQCLREAFSRGALFTENTPAGIAACVVQASQERERLRCGADDARRVRLATWQRVREELLDAVGLNERRHAALRRTK